MKSLFEAILRDWFAAHAPDKVPEWFPERPVYIEDSPVPPAEIKDVAGQWLDDPCYDFADCFIDDGERDLDDLEAWPPKYYDLAVAFENEMKAYWKREENRKKSAEEHRFFAWRWYYAGKMVTERRRK